MDDKELLQLYFDGELSGPEAVRAEKLIENDPEAASEFADLTAIRRACANERLAIAAPAESREKIFAAVGYSTASLPFYLKRYSAIAGVVLLVTVALYWALNNKINNKADVKDNTEFSSNSRQSAPPVISSKEIPLEKSARAIASARPNARGGARLERNYGSVAAAPRTETNAKVTQPTPTAQQTQYPAQDRRPELSRSTIRSTPANRNSLASAVSLFDLLSAEPPQFKESKAPKNKSWSITLKGGTPSNGTVGFGRIANFFASVLLATDNNLSVGLEGGSIYFTKNAKDEVSGVVSESSNNVIFIGISGKYLINDWSVAGVTPFGSVTLAGSGYGPMGKFGLGIQKGILSDRVNLILGYDYNGLFYKYDGSYKGSGTQSLNVGIMYKF